MAVGSQASVRLVAAAVTLKLSLAESVKAVVSCRRGVMTAAQTSTTSSRTAQSTAELSWIRPLSGHADNHA